MSKKRFDPNILNDRAPSKALTPLDFMRPMDDAGHKSVQEATEASQAQVIGSASQTKVMSSDTSHTEGVPLSDDPRRQPVDKSERPIPVGLHMYPMRHRQVKYEAFMRGLKEWQIVEEALEEYFVRHNRGKHKRN